MDFSLIISCFQLYLDVNEVLEKYLNNVARVSQDMVSIRKMAAAH